MTPRRQAAIGLLLAAFILAGWAFLHVYSIFFLKLEPATVPAVPFLVAAICWLNVGLFIVAHDCMHGSLAPGHARINRIVGTIVLALYAGFSYARILPNHHAHHKHPGSRHDPDHHGESGGGFASWYLAFLRRYFGLREFAVLAAALAFYVFVLRAPVANLLLFWALPALLSSLQLFFFGTFLPHRLGAIPFADKHNARSNGYSWLLSLITCFHFGYHHEHHLEPHVPWWRLPSRRIKSAPSR